MRTVGRRVVAAVALAFLNSCGGGGSPSAPSAPAPVPPPTQEIVLVSSTPASGATVTVAECPAGDVRPICASQPSLAFRTTFDRSLSEASVFVEFYTAAGLRCAVAVTPRTSVAAGSATTMTTTLTFLSLPPDFPQFCPLPVTTTRVVAYLVEGASTRVLTREFTGTYTFTMAGGGVGGGPAPTPTPTPRATPTPAPAPTANPAPDPVGYPACTGSPAGKPCGRATGQCQDNTYTCSQNRSGTCSGHGGLQCVFCPGAICQGFASTPEESLNPFE